jgi:hypothetical protein
MGRDSFAVLRAAGISLAAALFKYRRDRVFLEGK